MRGDPLFNSLIGDTFGEGGGVGVTVCCCFSAMELRVFMSRERSVGTCCFMSMLSSSLRREVMRSELGQANSSDMVITNMRPSVDVSALCRSCKERKYTACQNKFCISDMHEKKKKTQL